MAGAVPKSWDREYFEKYKRLTISKIWGLSEDQIDSSTQERLNDCRDYIQEEARQERIRQKREKIESEKSSIYSDLKNNVR